MSGVTDLGELLAAMRPVLTPGEWVFVTGAAPVDGAIATVVEEEGVTSVVDRATAERVVAEVGGLEQCGPDVEPVMARITLQVHSALEAVGLTAAVATALAARGIPANVVAGYFHDHVFVPLDRAGEAVAALEEISRA